MITSFTIHQDARAQEKKRDSRLSCELACHSARAERKLASVQAFLCDRRQLGARGGGEGTNKLQSKGNDPLMLVPK